MRYLRGHMGGDEVIVVAGNQRTAGREREIARAVLAHPRVRALEMVFVYPGPEGHDRRPVLHLRMVDSTTGDYLAVCGGVTQVLGHVLARRDHLDFLGLPIPEPVSGCLLRTGRYTLPLRIERAGGGIRVHTDMKEVAEAWLDGPRFDLKVCGTPASFLGEFTLVEADALPREDDGRPRLTEIHREVAARTGSSPETYYAGTYRRIGALHYRTRFRFWPPPRVEHFACGSGSTALALRLALGSPEAGGDWELEYRFEVECEPPGRLGESRVRLAWRGGALRAAGFSHDTVEILGGGGIGLDPLEIREGRQR